MPYTNPPFILPHCTGALFVDSDGVRGDVVCVPLAETFVAVDKKRPTFQPGYGGPCNESM